MSEENIKMLGLGSIVKAKTPETEEGRLYVIVARAMFPDEGGFKAMYRIALHPFGDAQGQEILTIREFDITEVVFEGYWNSADDDFVASLAKKIGASQPASSAPTSDSQTAEAKVETEAKPEVKEVPPEPKKDRFAKFK